jgi:hypothetical protein
MHSDFNACNYKPQELSIDQSSLKSSLLSHEVPARILHHPDGAVELAPAQIYGWLL